MADTILQHPVATGFIYPFLLVFFILFAVLEKTKIFGDKNKQINALVSFVIGLIFVSALSPKMIISNMILYLTVALVIMFVVMLLWGFVYGDGKEFKITGAMKVILAIIIGVGTLIAVLWSTGVDLGILGNIGEGFWTNFFFILLIGAALAIALSQKN
jgi:hypothetical protein